MAIVACFSLKTNSRSMADKHNEITGIILAGGKSLRMGEDKGLILYNGRPMITYSIDLLKQFCSRILISTANPAYQVFGYRTIPDTFAGIGPLGGLYSCIKESTSKINICLPCDLPKMQSGIIDYMLLASDGKQCVVPLTPYPEPLVAIYPSIVSPVMHQLITKGNYRMTGIFENFPVHYLPLEEFPGDNNLICFSNFNTPSDLFGIVTE